MSFALNLTPKSGIYLRTDIVQQQLNENGVELDLVSANAIAGSDTPKLRLDGAGRAYLTGSIRLSGGTPTAGDALFTLPSWVSVDKDYYLSVLKKSGTTFSGAGVNILNDTSGIGSVTVNTPGSYESMPTIGTSGPGTGATLVPRAYVISATLLGNPTGDTSNIPGDLITLADSSSSEVAAVLQVATTGVYSAVVAAGGSGGTDGTQTVTGTTGTGTKFTANVTISGGAITAVNSITTAGSYTVNPTSLAAEPVTGASLTGATLTVRMKPVDLTVNIAGSYLDFSTPIAQTGTANPSGAGGCTFDAEWGLLSIAVTSPGEGYDNNSAITITGGGGSGATATINLADAGTNGGQVSGVLAMSATQNDILYLDGTVFFVENY